MSATRHATRTRTTRLVTLAAAAGAALIAGAAGPAAAAPKEPLSYVALGDSYASGFGAGSYVNDCGQSPLGLPGILDRKKRIDLVTDATCAGARVVPDPAAPIDLPDQLAALSVDTDLVTISAGGNDAGFGEVAGVCLTQSAETCSQFIAGKNATVLPALSVDLGALYDDIRDAAPGATVVVTGYPHLFSPEFGNTLIPLASQKTSNVPPASQETLTVPLASQEAFNAGTDALNALIRDQAEANGFIFVDVVPKFERHGLGSRNPWITLQPGPAADNLHPTAKGYKSGYYPAVRSAVNFSQLQR